MILYYIILYCIILNYMILYVHCISYYIIHAGALAAARELSPYCGEAELWFVVGFLLFSTLLQNVAGISLEFHRNVELEHLK